MDENNEKIRKGKEQKIEEKILEENLEENIEIEEITINNPVKYEKSQNTKCTYI